MTTTLLQALRQAAEDDARDDEVTKIRPKMLVDLIDMVEAGRLMVGDTVTTDFSGKVTEHKITDRCRLQTQTGIGVLVSPPVPKSSGDWMDAHWFTLLPEGNATQNRVRQREQKTKQANEIDPGNWYKTLKLKAKRARMDKEWMAVQPDDVLRIMDLLEAKE